MTVPRRPESHPVPSGCDVAVFGGGAAGSACAIALAALGVDVLLAERGSYDSHRIGETLAPAAYRPLAVLGAEGILTDPPHRRAVALRSVWGESTAREHSYMFEPYAVGWHLDRAAFDASLAAVAAQRGVRLARRARVVRLDSHAGGWRLRIATANGSEVQSRCRFLVDATGRPATLARRLGARTLAHDRLVAHYRVLPRGLEPLEPVTIIEAISDGWWYTAPLPDGRLVAALLTDHNAGRCESRERWYRSLARGRHTAARTRGRPGAWEEPRTTSARSTSTRKASGTGWVAVGDAASARDPLAGDGIVRALKDGIRAAHAVAAALAGDPQALTALAIERDAEYAGYLHARERTYGLERRWQDRPFWALRAVAPRLSERGAWRGPAGERRPGPLVEAFASSPGVNEFQPRGSDQNA